MTHDEYDALRGLLDVALERTEHRNHGECPEPSQPDASDPDCPACRAIMRAESMVNDFGKQEGDK